MFSNVPDTFYPTPENLVYKMLEKVDLKKHSYILEPSCGKGNIIDYTKKYFESNNKRYMGYNQTADNYLTFDAIENDDNLISLCRGKGINIVWNDFLTFDPPRFYDLILLNPPFINGDKHLLQAIRIQERVGGEIVCILNADTIRNPYSNDRKYLISKLNQYNADIEYMEEAFSDAERKTNVEIALIYVQVPMVNMETMFEKEFKQDNPDLHIHNIQSLMPKMNKLEQLVFEYNMLKDATIEQVIEDGKFYIVDYTSINNNYGNPIITEHYKGVWMWTSIRKPNKNKVSLIKNDDIRIYYSQRTISALFAHAYHFGFELDPVYQRGLVWDLEDKVALIDSIFNNVDIGKFTFIKPDNIMEKNEVLDGKQRLSTLLEYYEDRFEYKGYKFSDLSARDQDFIENYSISWGETEGLTEEQKLRYFIKLNTTGKPMDEKHIDKVKRMLEENK